MVGVAKQEPLVSTTAASHSGRYREAQHRLTLTQPKLKAPGLIELIVVLARAEEWITDIYALGARACGVSWGAGQ